MGTNGPLKPHRVCIRITALHYVDLLAVNAEHAQGQAHLQTAFVCGVPSGGRVDPDTGDVGYPPSSPVQPVTVRLDLVENIRVDGVEELD